MDVFVPADRRGRSAGRLAVPLPCRRAKFYPSAVRFYSTTAPNRNARNLLKTNNRWHFYSTEDRGGSRAILRRIWSPQKLRQGRGRPCRTLEWLPCGYCCGCVVPEVGDGESLVVPVPVVAGALELSPVFLLAPAIVVLVAVVVRSETVVMPADCGYFGALT